MDHSDFKIGVEFMTGAGRWRCTDVGTRSIAAIRLDLDHDPSWYHGPPYAIAEAVFDEDDMIACDIAPDDRTFDDSGKSRIVIVPRERSCAFPQIRAIDYTVVLARDMAAMRTFYADVLGFDSVRELSPNWLEYRVGDNILALAKPRLIADDAPTPAGSAALQLAFRVPIADVDRCADELTKKGIALLSPPTDQSFGHRTLFFRDPDGNLLEIFADIPSRPSA